MGISLKNKVAIITGASSGMGKEIALMMAKKGAIPVLVARRMEKLLEIQAAIEKSGGEAFTIPADITKTEEVDQLFEKVIEKYGRLDILVNNAGFGMICLLEDIPLQDFHDIVNTNLVAPFYLCKKALPLMKKQGNGHIINISSVIGRRGMPHNSAYCATKFGLIGLTESLRVENMGTPVKISLVNPGLTNTEFKTGVRNPARLTIKDTWQYGAPASKVAKAVIRCAKHPRREVYISWYDRFLIFFNSLFPGTLEHMLVLYRRFK
jgi:short-subunit dehydrogenase